MSKTNNKPIPFVAISIILYMSFMIMDIFRMVDTTYIKYCSIILCFIYALINRNNLIKIAMFFTVVSDFFLLVLNKYYLVGVICFIIVQITYVFYLDRLDIDTHLLLRIIVPLLVCVLLSVLNINNTLYTFTVFYFSQLVISALSLINKKHRLFCVGLCLFVCCDICVGLHNIYPANSLIALGQWFFYLPSQVLIVLGSQ